jgi:hypothetical protein
MLWPHTKTPVVFDEHSDFYPLRDPSPTTSMKNTLKPYTLPTSPRLRRASIQLNAGKIELFRVWFCTSFLRSHIQLLPEV